MAVPEITVYYDDDGTDTLLDVPVQSVTVTRGRSRQLNRFEAGSATINFYNGGRLLDPLNSSSTYASVVVPRVRMKIFAGTQEIFTGLVTDWDVEYDITTKDTATAYLSDELTLFSNIVFTEVFETTESSPGVRIDDLLDYFNYSGATSLDSGNANLGGYDIPVNTQLTDYFFNVAQSDNGNFFVAADGTVTFIGRYGRRPVSELTFADDGTGVLYSALQNEYGDELLFNHVSVSSPAGNVILDNTTSISNYGLSVITFDGLLNANYSDLEAIAEDILDKYGEPVVRFTGLQVQLAGLDSSDVTDVLDLDLADQVSVKKSFSVGSPSSVTQSLIVTGIRHRIVPGSHTVEFSFEPSPYEDAFVLDDATLGTLDNNVLG